MVNGQVVEIAKAKGYNTTSFDEHTALLEGATVEKDVLQFKAGKSLLLMDQEIEGRVKVVKQKKNICQYDKSGALKYSKGYIIGQEVQPFHFEDGEFIPTIANATPIIESIEVELMEVPVQAPVEKKKKKIDFSKNLFGGWEDDSLYCGDW